MTIVSSSFNFPRVEARRCTCCSVPLTTGFGFAVPYIGTVGPKCVRKFALLAQALTLLDGLTFTADAPTEVLRAISSLRGSLLMHIGFEARIVSNADGSKRLVVGARKHERASVSKTWRERQAEFIRDLKTAGLQLEAEVPAEVPVLDEAAIASMSLPERRAVALEHGVLTATGKASTTVSLIWEAVQAAQLGEAEAVAVAEVPTHMPVLTLSNPVFDEPFVLPYVTGPFEQLQQRHFTQLAVPALPFSPPMLEEEVERRLEAATARRLDFHIRELQARARGDEVECDRLYELQCVETRHMAGLTAALDGPYQQPEQRHMSAVAMATTYPEAECDRCGALLNALGGCPVCDQEEVELNFAEAAAEARASHHVPSASFSEDADLGAAHCRYCGWPHERCHCPHAQEQQQQQAGGAVADAPATCISCEVQRADPRQTCRCCQGAVCLLCAAYDEHGTLYCADCLAESLAADVDDAEGSW